MVRRILLTFSAILPGILFTPCFAPGQDTTHWRLDAGATYSAFQQQVKAEVGDPRGERLVNESQFGFVVSGMYEFHENFQAGLFFQFDRGNRLSARFDGLDAQGITKTKDKIGGDFSEIWLGPLVRVSWKNLFVEGGYGAFGGRTDEARTDLVSSSGDSTSSFSFHPTIALLAAVGAAVPIFSNLDLTVKMEYRLRYYSKRGGLPLQNNLEHGSQNMTPFVGISWRF